MRSATIALAAGMVAAAWPLAAQQHAREFEVGAFGAYTQYDDAFDLSGAIGGGARFGYFFTRNLGLEVSILFQPQLSIPGSSSTFEPIIGSGSVVFALPVGSVSALYLLGGYSRLDFASVDPYKFTDGAIHGGAGVRISLSRYVAIRLEGRGLYTPETGGAFGTKSATHLMATAGLSVFHSDAPRRTPPVPLPTPVEPLVPSAPAAPPSDADSDGVADVADACPDTPMGATVDARGCPADSDGDKVWDGLDQCADTPAGAVVDALGCPSDADGDRVYDGIDQCPATAPGATVNALGCPADADADRVQDGVDQCPDTPLGAVVDARGCPVDSDGDAVFDGLDMCPGTPSGGVVDARGCQSEVVTVERDSDGDGVLDGADRCPHTPAGTPVDAAGCVILFKEEPGEKAAPLVLQGVTFGTGRSVITAESFAVLDAVAASLLTHGEVRIEIAGHTDDTGSEAVNLRLSQGRASAVRAYLARKGVAPDRMVARGYGETQPAVPNTTVDGRAQNRRVELRRIN